MMHGEAYPNEEAISAWAMLVSHLQERGPATDRIHARAAPSRGKSRTPLFPNPSSNPSSWEEASVFTHWVGGCNAGLSDFNLNVMERGGVDKLVELFSCIWSIQDKKDYFLALSVCTFILLATF